MENYVNFYPTPQTLLEQIMTLEDMKKVKTVLEPSAGKADICKHLEKVTKYHQQLDIDCIEINADLRATLKGNEYKVVHDDFLTYESYKKYDLIVMNPPFDAGAKHLLKAITMQEKMGGKIICILNAETLKNPYTLERQELLKKLEQYEADIQYMESEFSSAERSTDVEIAVIKLSIEKEHATSVIWENLKRSYMVKEQETEDITDIAINDYIKAAVQRYNIEIQAGLKLIAEYKALAPYIMDYLRKDGKSGQYDKPILSMTTSSNELSENEYIEAVRVKYWEALFGDERFTKAMPSDMLSEYRSNIRELKHFEFSYYNIKELQIQFCGNMLKGIEETILNLFEEMTHKYSYSSEFGNNVHYYNGWTTNKAYYVNKKVILPYHAYNHIWKKLEFNYDQKRDLRDMEKAFDYLAGTPGSDSNVNWITENANQTGNFKNVEFKYFTVTVYKKGTIHITFKDEDLLKKLNIFAGKHYNMLPPCYGKKSYSEMTKQEQAVVDEFDGSKESYKKIHENQDKYLYEVTIDTIPRIA